MFLRDILKNSKEIFKIKQWFKGAHVAHNKVVGSTCYVWNALSLWEKKCFATTFAIKFLSYKGHLHLIVFICREC